MSPAVCWLHRPTSLCCRKYRHSRPKNDAYQLALIQAKDRAIQNVALKNALRQEVVDLLDQLVNLLVVANNGEPSWIVNAGMVPTQKRQRVMADIPVPVNLQVKRSDQPGELIIKFQNRSPKRILTNAVEYSTDGGMSWKNGTYGNSRGILLSGLPSRQEVLVKVRSLPRPLGLR